MARYIFCEGKRNLTHIVSDGACRQNDPTNVEEPEEPEEQEVTEERDCTDRCTKELSPVCGTDNTTYENLCKLNIADCNSATEIRKQHDGECIEEKECSTKCKNGSLGKKVCGTDGVTYNSMCHLKKANCKSDVEIDRQHKGKCKPPVKKPIMVNDSVGTVDDIPEPECPKFCNKMSAPVCGSDYKTYGNECTLNKEKCDNPSVALYKLNDGECKCPAMCPRIWKPVCGTDNEEYPSPCELKRATCEGETIVEIAKYGPCDKSATLMEPDVHNKKVNTSCPCPKHYKLVCGSDGKNYNNECTAECAGVKIAKHRPCKPLFANDYVEPTGPTTTEKPEPTEPAKSCQKICTRIFMETCGKNKDGYIMYSNPCMMDVLTCEANDPARQVNKNVCGMKKDGTHRFFHNVCFALGLNQANIHNPDGPDLQLPATVVDDENCEAEEEEETFMAGDFTGKETTDAMTPQQKRRQKNRQKNNKNKQKNIWDYFTNWRQPFMFDDVEEFRGRKRRSTEN
jgi:coxsackievirus/adenovirus receptor